MLQQQETINQEIENLRIQKTGTITKKRQEGNPQDDDRGELMDKSCAALSRLEWVWGEKGGFQEKN